MNIVEVLIKNANITLNKTYIYIVVHNLIKRNDIYMKAKSKNLETDANLCHRLVTLCYSRGNEASVINCDHLYTRDIWAQPNIEKNYRK